MSTLKNLSLATLFVTTVFLYHQAYYSKHQGSAGIKKQHLLKLGTKEQFLNSSQVAN